MSIGAPSNLGTLLVQKLDAALGITLGQQANISAGAGPQAVPQPASSENPSALQNPTHRNPREAVDQANAEGQRRALIGKAMREMQLDNLLGRSTTFRGATQSAPTTLGFAARIILALIHQYPQGGQPIQGRNPLLSTPNGQQAGAKPDAATTLAGKPATGGAPPGNLAALPRGMPPAGPNQVWAQLASSLNQPGALSARFAQALSQSIQSSGLFYESHLAQLTAGKTTLQALRQEPQGQIPTQGSQASPPGQSGQANQPSHAAQLGQATQSSHATLLGQATQPNHATQLGQATQPNHAAQAAVRTPASLSTIIQQSQLPQADSGNLPGQTTNSQQTAGANQAAANPHQQAPIPAIDPQAHLMVRQQLEVLANQGFIWQGEAWPGAKMECEVRRRQPDDGQDPAVDQEHWSTRLTLRLPVLGEIQARLSLSGDQLVMRLLAPSSADRLAQAVEPLRSRLQAQGLQASQLAILAQEPPPPAKDTNLQHPDTKPDEITTP